VQLFKITAKFWICLEIVEYLLETCKIIILIIKADLTENAGKITKKNCSKN
jgi:hypothetical protein